MITGNPVDGDLTSYRTRESDLYRKIFTPESDDYDMGVRPPGLENAGRFTIINKGGYNRTFYSANFGSAGV